jgi:ATP-dependent protease ClpP protease subunit
LIVPDKNFRLDPQRAIYVTGLIDDALVSRLTPQILRLQSVNRLPISVYIDSPGGSVSSMETILRLLNLTDQDSSGPCNIVTAVTTRAASAAADLLSSGDYALAFPNSSILYHGLRTFEKNPLTFETSSMLANTLRVSNDYYAMALARKIEDRFSFRYVTVRTEFDAFRTNKSAPSMSDLDCFVEIISTKLSDGARKVWQKAQQRHGRYQDLLDSVLKRTRRNFATQTVAEIEADNLKAIIAFELKSNKKNPKWSFRTEGLGRLADDFFLLNEYVTTYSSDRLQRWCTSFGKWTLPTKEAEEIDAIADEKERSEKLVAKVRPILQPIWSFFVALCHALQEGENELTAIDAYWLGLVDEVIGESDLWTWRDLFEVQPDPPSDTEPNEEAKENTEKAPSSAGTETGTA